MKKKEFKSVKEGSLFIKGHSISIIKAIKNKKLYKENSWDYV